jgi:hypothetical protein
MVFPFAKFFVTIKLPLDIEALENDEFYIKNQHYGPN